MHVVVLQAKASKLLNLSCTNNVRKQVGSVLNVTSTCDHTKEIILVYEVLKFFFMHNSTEHKIYPRNSYKQVKFIQHLRVIKIENLHFMLDRQPSKRQSQQISPAFVVG